MTWWLRLRVAITCPPISRPTFAMTPRIFRSAAGASGPTAASDGKSVTVSAGVAQLFVDDHLIDRQTNLKRTLHQPRKDNGGNVPIIDAKEGTTLLAYGSIVRDPRLDFFRGLAVRHGKLDCARHDQWIAGMEAASQVGLIDQRHGQRVVAHAPGAEALAHVAVQENKVHAGSLGRQERMRKARATSEN